MLNMRSSSRYPPEDLTARARIRDTAIRRFATDGMEVSLRTIAGDAEVSAGLILHHFSSRAGLREACDSHVLEQIRQHKSGVLDSTGIADALLTQLEHVEDHALLVAYVLRCIQAGGPPATEFIDHLVADTLNHLQEGVEAGTVHPSRDPEARARLIVEQSVGALLLQLPAQRDHLDVEALPAWLRHYIERIILPTLELFTDPLFTDTTLLNTYLATVESPSGRTAGRERE